MRGAASAVGSAGDGGNRTSAPAAAADTGGAERRRREADDAGGAPTGCEEEAAQCLPTHASGAKQGVRGGEHLPARAHQEPMNWQGVQEGEHLPAPAREELMQGLRGGGHQRRRSSCKECGTEADASMPDRRALVSVGQEDGGGARSEVCPNLLLLLLLLQG